MTDTTTAARPAHTPGPWKVSTLFDKHDALLIDGPEGSGVTVARVACFGAQAETPHAQLPNARLIAAAPELLEALHQLIVVIGLTAIKYQSALDILQAAVDEARAVIAKATGSAS